VTANALTIANGLAPPNPENVVDFEVLDQKRPPFDRLAKVEVEDLELGQPTTALVTDGAWVWTTYNVYQHSTGLMDGGHVEENFRAFDTATIVLSGGEVGGVVAFSDSRAFVQGGTFAQGGGILARSGTITLIGSTFMVWDNINSWLDGDSGTPHGLGSLEQPEGFIAGEFLDGSPFAFDFHIDQGGEIILSSTRFVPEPGTAVVVGLGLAVLRRTKRAS
jgi:hypothetical protein